MKAKAISIIVLVLNTIALYCPQARRASALWSGKSYENRFKAECEGAFLQ
jgi:hypothetical protein